MAELADAGSITEKTVKLTVGILLALLALVGAIAYKYYSDIRAWRRVEESVMRLNSGIKFEPIITLRSKIADSDAAIKIYESSGHLFPLDQKQRLEVAKKGIRYMDIAIEGAEHVEGWIDMRTNYMELTRFLPRKCYEGSLDFNRALAKEVFALGGSYLIREFVQEVPDEERKKWQEGLYPPLDLAKETADCQKRQAQAQERAAEVTKVAAAAHRAKWKYHIDVDNRQHCLVSAYVDGQSVLNSDFRPRFHLDANTEAYLSDVFCSGGSPEKQVSVKINGEEYVLYWEKERLGVTYSALIVPTEDD